MAQPPPMGRPRTLGAAQWRKHESDLRKTPRDFGLAATLGGGPVLAEHLRRRMIMVLDNARNHHAVLLRPFPRQHGKHRPRASR